MTDEEERCPFCSRLHEQLPPGILDGPFAGLVIPTCPEIPSSHVYEDVVFESGPRGRLHRLEPDE